MDFIPEEEVLYDNRNLGLTLTTHRVRSESHLHGYYLFTSIMLEKVASVAITRINYPWLILIGVLVFIVGFLKVGSDVTYIYLLITGLSLFIGYFLTIRKALEIASCGAVIRINIPISVDMKEVKQFIEILEDAKDARYSIGKQD